jgi:hypothetical protein
LNAGEFWASLRYNPDIDEDYAFDRILSKAAERYYVTFTSTSVVLGRTKAGTNSSLRSAAKSLTPGRWYAVKLVAEGPLISVYVDDVLVLSATDTDPVPSGSIEFETKTRAQALLDNVQVVAQVPCEYTWTRTKTFPVGGDINVIAVDPTHQREDGEGVEKPPRRPPEEKFEQLGHNSHRHYHPRRPAREGAVWPGQPRRCGHGL